ncbi:MAG: M28 family peptidase [Bacteroidales bacterium]|nr:M28 family peptidase [Bacteroidales bacterium]
MLLKHLFAATLLTAATLGGFIACDTSSKQVTPEAPADTLHVPAFNADTAFAYIEAQCALGYRVPGTEVHRKAATYIADAFRMLGLAVEEQNTMLTTYNGVTFPATNIIARYRPEATQRILLGAHWDTRPWADNDPDAANHRHPVMGANDGASGVAVMLEIARQLVATQPNIGIDFVAFDGEDHGVAQWDTYNDYNGSSWCLGSQYWAAQARQAGYRPTFGILLDMVGGQGAKFYREGFSMQYASGIVDLVWSAAERAGYGSYFPKQDGGMITDDHVPVNRIAGIPMIDIIPFFPDHPQGTFGPTWHTIYDTPENIDRATLKAVGQTVLQVIFEQAAS